MNIVDTVESMLKSSPDQLPVFETALAMSSHRYPTLDVEIYTDMMHKFKCELGERVGQSPNDTPFFVLNKYMFEELRFQPNVNDYYNPKNSCLSDVLSTRSGIPITLSLIYIELGRSIGMSLQGACYPGHFLVRYESAQGLSVIDVFDFGRSLTNQDLRNLLTRAGYREVSNSIIYSSIIPSSAKLILTRLLMNLKIIYDKQKLLDKSLIIHNWIIALGLAEPSIFRDRGIIYQKENVYGFALRDLERYLELEENAKDFIDIRERTVQLRQLTSRLN